MAATDDFGNPIPRQNTPTSAMPTPAPSGPGVDAAGFATKNFAGNDPNSTANANLAAAVEASRPKLSDDPYERATQLGIAPVAPTGPAPTSGQFIENPGGGLGVGHFASPDDLQAHRDAFGAAKAYADLAKVYHDQHNATQEHLDTAGAFHELTGFDSTHPNAVQNLMSVRAKYPNARPEAFAYAEKAIERSDVLNRQLDVEKQKAADKAAAAPDEFRKSLQTTKKITPEELILSPAVAGTVPGSPAHPAGNKEFNMKDEAQGGDMIRIFNGAGKPVYFPKMEYYNLKAEALKHFGKTVTPTAAPGQTTATPTAVPAPRPAQTPAPSTNPKLAPYGV